MRAFSQIIFSILFRVSNHQIVDKKNSTDLLFTFSYLNSNFPLTLGYLNPALNTPAPEVQWFLARWNQIENITNTMMHYYVILFPHIANVFQISSTPTSYKKLAKGFEQMRNGKIVWILLYTWISLQRPPWDRRKWPLQRGGRCREVLNKSRCIEFLSNGTKKVIVVERRPLAGIRL